MSSYCANIAMLWEAERIKITVLTNGSYIPKPTVNYCLTVGKACIKCC